MATTLPLFWNLSSTSKDERLEASVKLIGALEDFQIKFKRASPHEASSDDETQPLGNLEVLNSPDVSYAIRRLIRGLASPRESSRLGFAVAFTELLSRITSVTSSQIIALVIEASQTQGWMKGHDERDVLFARLFGLTSVIQSGLLFKTNPLPLSPVTIPSSTLVDYQTAIKELLNLGEKKSWLRESCWWSIMLAIGGVQTSEETTWNNEASTWSMDTIFFENKQWFPEKVALWLKLKDPDKSKYLSTPFKGPHILAIGNLNMLAKILRDGEVDDDEEDVRKSFGSWKPRPHFVWDVILDHYLSQDNLSLTQSIASFQDFFRVVIDESLFTSNSSSERKFWGFQIIEKVLPRLKPSNIPFLFTKNFMRTWINHLSHEDRYLHKAARKLASEIQRVVQQDTTIGFPLVLQLLGGNGSLNFDKITNTKTVTLILASMDHDGIVNYIEYLTKQIYDIDPSERKDSKAVDAKRTWAIDQLLALVRNGSITKDDEWIQSVLEFLVVHAFFIIKAKNPSSPYRCLRHRPKPPLSDDLHQTCRRYLMTCLANLTSQVTLIQGVDGKPVKLPGCTSDGEFWVSKVLDIVKSLEESEHVAVISKVKPELTALHKKTFKVINQLKKVQDPRQDTADGLRFLLLSVMLETYINAEDSEQEEASQCLQECLDNTIQIFPLHEKLPQSNHSSLGSDPEPEAMDLIIDTLIGFLSDPTPYIRAVSYQVFSLVTRDVTNSSMDLILKQLDLQDRQDDTDVEMAIGEDVGSQDEETKSQESSDEAEESDNHRPEASRVTDMGEGEGGSTSNEDSEEDILDDDQMMQLDGKLVEMFRSQTGDKNKKDAGLHRETTQFRLRILDFVDVYMKKQPGNALNLKVVLPLVRVILSTGTDEKQLAEKTLGLLRSRIAKVKEIPVTVEAVQLEEDMKELHKIAQKSTSQNISSILSPCCLYLARSLAASGSMAAVTAVYQQSAEDFLIRKGSHIRSNFLQDFIRRMPMAAWGIRQRLVELCSTGHSVNAYRQCQAFQLLSGLLAILLQLPDSKSDAISFIPRFRAALFETISMACANDSKFTATQVRDLFKVARHGVQQTKRLGVSPEDLTDIWDHKSLVELRATLLSSNSSKATTTMCQQLLDSISGSTTKRGVEQKIVTEGSASKPSKRKATAADDLDQVKKVRRKKAKKNQD